MRHRTMGRTGLKVSELCFGAMTFGGRSEMWRGIGGLGEKDADEMVGCALDAGINFFDTANGYGDGDSEVLLGKALGERRRDVIIATKFGFTQGPGPNEKGGSRAHIVQAAEESLARLGTDWIDVYILHRRDPATPLEETLRALDDLVRAGKVRYAGISNHPAWQMMKANAAAEARGLVRFEVVQAFYALSARDIEREIVPFLSDQNVGLMVWSPLAGGLLTGKYKRDAKPAADARRASFDIGPTDWDRVERVLAAARPMAEERGASFAQVALAWVLAKKHVTSVIIGARRLDQLEANLKCTRVELSAGEIARLDDASALAPEYPGWFLERFDSL